MRIEIGENEKRILTVCKIETIGSVDIYENYTGITMVTKIGEFGICERDDGIWILKDGVEVYRYDMNGPAIVDKPEKKEFELTDEMKKEIAVQVKSVKESLAFAAPEAWNLHLGRLVNAVIALVVEASA